MDYVQLLMIGRAIWAKNVDRNTKKWKRPSKSSKNKMFVFGLHSTSDDRPSNLSKNVDQNTQKWKRPRRSLKNKMFVFWITFNFWWSAKLSEQITLTEAQKNEKGPLSHRKIKCSFLDYVQLLMIGQAIWAKNVDRNAKKLKIGSLSHQKIKCLFLDYVQLLRIGRVIWAKNIDRNAKKWKRPPKSSKNKMFVFGLRSTSDDEPSNLSKNCQPKCKKMRRPPKSSKNKMFIFGLCSTSDDRPSDLSK